MDHLNHDAVVMDISTDPQSEAEKACARWYDVTRRALLRMHTWNFAIKRRSLALGGAPSFHYSNYYNLPTDYIRLVGIGDENDIEVDYEIEDGKILIDNGDAALKLRYIYDQTDVNKFDAMFVEGLALLLAIRLAKSFSTDKSRRTELRDEWKEYKSDAFSIDGQERPPRRYQRSKFLSSRKTRSKSTASTKLFET